MSKRYGKGAKVEVEEEEEDRGAKSSTVSEMLTDWNSVLVVVVLIALLCMGCITMWVNQGGSISTYVATHGVQKVISLDNARDATSAAQSKDKEDLLETYAAVDSIERAVQHGNIAGARLILNQLVTTKTISESDIVALAKLIDDAEAENPIADIGECRAQDALDFVVEKGGKFVMDESAEAKEAKDKEKEYGVMMADFDHDKEQADGRGRGIAALKEMKEGEVLMEIPAAAMMTSLNAAASPALAKVFKEQKQIKPFVQLALYLLREAHDKESVHRRHICSFPLHVPLPFLWADSDLPPDFIADAKTTAGRLVVRQLVDASYNMTVPLLTEKYPEVFPAEMFSPSKWSWAISIILSRAIPLKKSFMGGISFEDPTNLDPETLLDQLNEVKKDDGVYPAIAPMFDMLNHEGSASLRCNYSLKSDGTMQVITGPSGLKRGYEIAVTYGTHLCGTMPLNRYGFVLQPCPGDEAPATEEEPPAVEGGAAPEEAAEEAA